VDTINIVTGKKQVVINRDEVEAGVISFNPYDVVFREKYYNLLRELNEDSDEIKDILNKAKKIDDNKELDDMGIRKSIPDEFELTKEVNRLLCEKIDNLFGSGTSEIIRGDFEPTLEQYKNAQSIYQQFFTAIKPYFEDAAQNAVQKYTSPAGEKRNKRKTKR
jgi:hypothetical protein